MYFECSEKWYPLIQNMLQELRQKSPKTVIFGIKEKWGKINIYSFDDTDESNEIISRYEKIINQTCSLCGKNNATQHSLNGWLYTVCEKCSNENKMSKIIDGNFTEITEAQENQQQEEVQNAKEI